MTAEIIPFPHPRQPAPTVPSEAALRYFDEIMSRPWQYELRLDQPSAIALAALDRILKRRGPRPIAT